MLMANNSSTTPAQKKTGLQVFAQICAAITIVARVILSAICIKTAGGFSKATLNVLEGSNYIEGGGGVPNSDTVFLLVLVIFGAFGLITYLPSIITVILAFIKKARSGIVIAGAITFGVTLLINILCAAVIAYFNHY